MFEFRQVGTVDELSRQATSLVVVDGRPIVLARTSDGFRAIDNYCTHMGAPLAEGVVEGDEIVCPWHAARFAIETGEASRGPARCTLPTYAVRIRQGCVEVAVDVEAEKPIFRAPAAQQKKSASVSAA